MSEEKPKENNGNKCTNGRKKHEWETVRSFGYWAQESQCVKCGKVAVFVIKEKKP